MAASLPLHLRTRDGSAARGRNVARQSILHIRSQCRVQHEFGGLGPPCGSVGMPLCCVGTVLQAATARGCVAPKFTRDRRGRSSQLSSNLPHAFSTSARQRNLFTLREGKVATCWL